MKYRGTYALLALFFSGLIGLWAADFAQVPTRLKLERMNTRILHELLDTKPDDVRKVEILGEGGPLVFERREGNRWQMTAPMDVEADPSKVETLAYNLKELARRPDSAPIDGDPDRYGLAPPERVIKLWGPATDAPLASLEVGRVSLDRRYVRAVGSEAIEAVDAKGLDLLRLPAVRWRDHELFRIPSFEVESLALSSRSENLKFKRSRDAWRIVEPVNLLAVYARVGGLIAEFGTIRVLDDSRFIANDVKPADLERYGLKDPALTIDLVSSRVDRQKEPQSLQVGKAVEGQPGLVYARRADQDDVVAVDDRVLKGLRLDPNSYRSPKVADFQPARVLRIGVEGADGTNLEVVRIGNDWAIASPSLAKGDRQGIQEFLKSFDQLQTSIYLTPKMVAESGLDKPSMTIKLWQAANAREAARNNEARSKGELAVVLRIGRRDLSKKSIYAQIEGDPTILALPDSANAFLPRNPLAFRDRLVLAIEPDRIERVRMVGTGRNLTLNAPLFQAGKTGLGLDPVGWWMVEPVASPADAPSIGKLLRLLSNLRAEGLVTEKPGSLDAYGLKTPALTLTCSSRPAFSMIEKPRRAEASLGSDERDELSLLIGAALPDRPGVRYAKLADSSLIFTVGPDVLAILDAEWHDRRVLAFDPTQVRKLDLSWIDRGLSFVRSDRPEDAGWKLDGPDLDAPDFDLASIGPFLQSISKLNTLRFVQYTGDFPEGTDLATGRPGLGVVVELDGGRSSMRLRVGAPAGRAQRFASIGAEPNGAIFLVPDATFAPLWKTPRRRGDLPDDVFAP